MLLTVTLAPWVGCMLGGKIYIAHPMEEEEKMNWLCLEEIEELAFVLYLKEGMGLCELGKGRTDILSSTVLGTGGCKHVKTWFLPSRSFQSNSESDTPIQITSAHDRWGWIKMQRAGKQVMPFQAPVCEQRGKKSLERKSRLYRDLNGHIGRVGFI